MSVDRIQFACPKCGTKLRAAPSAAGKRLMCPACRSDIVIPGFQPPPLNRTDSVFVETNPPVAETRSSPVSGNTKFCFHCGSMISSLAEICPKCGVRQPNVNPAIGTLSSGPNRLTAALLAFFLGAIGVHKFYMGRTTAGIIYLLAVILTCGFGAIITSIVALIEGIVYLTYTDEQFSALCKRRFGVI